MVAAPSLAQVPARCTCRPRRSHAPQMTDAAQRHGRRRVARASGPDASNSNGALPDSGSIERAARALVQESPETIARISAAQQRVIELQAAQAEIISQIEAANSAPPASSDGAQKSLAAAADEVAAAARDFGDARQALQAAEGERDQLVVSLRKGEDRVQSLLAGAVGAAGGALVQLPLLATSQHPDAAKLISLGAVLASSALFGIVWRYVVRNEQDAVDGHLKAGCVTAFGLTAGLGQASVLAGIALEQGAQLTAPLFAEAAVITGAAMLQFTAASIVIEAAVSRNIIRRSSVL